MNSAEEILHFVLKYFSSLDLEMFQEECPPKDVKIISKRNLVYSTIAPLAQLHVRMEIMCGSTELIVSEYRWLHVMFFANYGKQKNARN